MPPMTGRVIAGRYNLQHPIGRGAMGVVWRARDQILDRDVAVKEVVISSLLGEDERRNAYQRTLREARTAARLSHRGLVTVYDVAEEDGRPWIVMELVPSRSLDQLLTVEGRLAPLRVARIGQQLLSALAAAHIAGVLHRDVKPSNVLIATDRTGTGWDERAVLTDFGIAQFEGDPRLTQTGMVMGSPGFTAPERIRGGDATPASDLWSLGATLYAAVEGRGPYEQRGGAITTMSAIINEDAPVAAHAGRLAPIIEALLRRDPSSRPTASAAARMFAYVLPLISAAEPEPPAAAHPPTLQWQAQPKAGRQLSAAAAPAAIAAPAPAIAATTPEAGSPAEPGSADAPEPKSAAGPGPGPEVKAAEAKVPEADGEADAADTGAKTEAAVRATPTPVPDTADAAGAAAEAGVGVGVGAETDRGADSTPDASADSADETRSADETLCADETMSPDDAVSPDEAVSAVDVASAVEAPQPPAGVEDADVPVATAVAAETAQRREAGAAPSSAGEAVIDRKSAEIRPQPKSAPTFTAAKPGERAAAPTFSAARPDQRGTAQRTPQAPHRSPQPSVAPSSPASYWGAPPGSAPQAGGQWAAAAPSDAAGATPQYASYSGASGSGAAGSGAGVAGQYAGPSQQYPDLATQYPPAPTGGTGPRRRASRWWLILVICVLVAAAIGAGAALALHHRDTGSSGSGTTVGQGDPKTSFGSVNALNEPSTIVPAGMTRRTATPSTYHTTAGFTVDVPSSWTEKRIGFATYFYGPGDMVLDIDLSAHTFPDNMVLEAENIQHQQAPPAGHALPGYRRLQLKAVPVRGTHGAFWQFSWSFKGVRMRTDDILFVLPTSAGQQSYAVYMRAPNGGWNDKYLPIFEKILPTFEPVD